MTRWIFTSRIEPSSIKGVISVRFGASVMFAAYSRALRQWYHVYPGGEEKIPEPQMIFVDEELARDNQREHIGSIVRRAGVRLRAGENHTQLSLSLQ